MLDQAKKAILESEQQSIQFSIDNTEILIKHLHDLIIQAPEEEIMQIAQLSQTQVLMLESLQNYMEMHKRMIEGMNNVQNG